MHRRRSAVAAALAAALAAGCGADETVSPASPPPDPIEFDALGPLWGSEGAGSFRFGAASAATQIEDQNVSTDWFLFTQPEVEGGLEQGEDFVGDASKGFSLAIEDVALMQSLGLDSYRFSIEWARVEPERDEIDEEALAHYDEFIDALLAAGIRPMITVHHFSNPVWVADPRDPECEDGVSDDNLCGLGHPEGGPQIVEEMAEHAALLADRYGDRVDEWATLNEPVNYLLAAYGIGVFPPGRSTIYNLLDDFIPVVRDYLLAHAAIYDALHETDSVDADDDGETAAVGLTLSVADWVPARFNAPSEDAEDVDATERLRYVFHYLLVDALLAGRFDPDIDGTLDEERPELEGRLDWLGLQYYFRAGVTGNNGVIPVLELSPCYTTFDFGSCIPPVDPTFCVPDMRYEHYAPGLHTVLMEYSTRYEGLPLVVTEGGIATEVGERRAENVVRALEQISRARADGADVRGYYHWSLYDNFEWSEGYGPRFGLFRVDYDTFERTPTTGADVYGQVIEGRLLTSEHRARFGGDGPMTPEDPDAPAPTACNLL